IVGGGEASKPAHLAPVAGFAIHTALVRDGVAHEHARRARAVRGSRGGCVAVDAAYASSGRARATFAGRAAHGARGTGAGLPAAPRGCAATTRPPCALAGASARSPRRAGAPVAAR